jgi:DNA polymerase-3 subunit epsilon
LYAVVDIETTGSRPGDDRITEIAIVVHDGEQVVDSYTTLINPERAIPFQISQLTGITDEMVRDAPCFPEVARRIVEMTDGKVFVAHNVRFDYSFLKAEFGSLGYNYQRKTLCTVRLSRKLIPGLPSYSLGQALRKHQDPDPQPPPGVRRRRGHGQLLDRMLKLDQSPEIGLYIEGEIRAQTLPPRISRDQVLALPEAVGVYYFLDERGPNPLRGQERQHPQPHHPALRHGLQKPQVHRVQGAHRRHCLRTDGQRTGGPAAGVRRDQTHQAALQHGPETHRRRLLGVYEDVDKSGYLTLRVDRVSTREEPLTTLENMQKAQNFLYRKIEQFGLCLQKCGLHKTGGPCFNYHIRKCNGACLGKEAADPYNDRVATAIQSFSFSEENFMIVGTGRHRGEKSVVCVEGGIYKGFGYFDPEAMGDDLAGLRGCVKFYAHNRDIQKIICGHLRKNQKDRLVRYQLDGEEMAPLA